MGVGEEGGRARGRERPPPTSSTKLRGPKGLHEEAGTEF